MPTTIESTFSGFMFPASKAALAAISCRSVWENPANFPPKVPKGVLLAATMNTLLTSVSANIHDLIKKC